MGGQAAWLLELRTHLRLEAVNVATHKAMAWSRTAPCAQSSDQAFVLIEFSFLIRCTAMLQRFSVRLGCF